MLGRAGRVQWIDTDGGLVGPKEKQAHDTLKGTELVARIKEIRLAAINDLVDRTLIIQEFKSKGYPIPEYSIDERMLETIRRQEAEWLKTLRARARIRPY
jgi:hypothetical protein